MIFWELSDNRCTSWCSSRWTLFIEQYSRCSSRCRCTNRLTVDVLIDVLIDEQ